MKTPRIVSLPFLIASAGLGLACGSESAVESGATMPPATLASAAEDAAPAPAPETRAEIPPGELFSDPASNTFALDDEARTNQAPRLLSLTVVPTDTVRTGDDITAMPEAEDPDGDVVGFRYRWKVNGRNVAIDGATLSSSFFDRGDRIELTVEADDGEDVSFPMSLDPIVVANSAPRIDSAPGPLDPDGTFRYEVGVDDPDSDRSFRFELRDPPEGMRIDPIGGAIAWTPRPDQAGVHPVTVAVDDRHDGVATQSFDLTIEFEAPTPAAAAP